MGKFSIAEDYQNDDYVTNPLDQGGLGFLLQWKDEFLQMTRKDILEQLPTNRNLNELVQYLPTLSISPPEAVSYCETHQTASLRLVNSFPPEEKYEASRLCISLLQFIPGIPMLFQGSEYLSQEDFNPPYPSVPFSQIGTLSYSNGAPIITNPGTLFEKFNFTRNLLDFRKTHPNANGLASANLNVQQHFQAEKCISFYRFSTFAERGDHTTVVANFDGSPHSLAVGVPSDGDWIPRFAVNHPGPEPVYLAQPIEAGGMSNSITVNLEPYSLIVISQDPIPPTTEPPTTEPPTTEPPTTEPPTTEPPTTEPPTTEPPATEPPTSEPPTTAAPQDEFQPFLVVSMRLLNLDYTWCRNNREVFDQAFKEFASGVVKVHSSRIKVVGVLRGSVKVQFEVESETPSETKLLMDRFLAQENPSMGDLAEQLPPEAFEDPNGSITVDKENSNTEIQVPSAPPTAGIVGGIIGGVIAVLVIVALVILVKKDQKDQKMKEELEPELDHDIELAGE